MRRVLLVCLLAVAPARADEQDDAARLLIEQFCNGTPAERESATLRLRQLGRPAWFLFTPCLDHRDPDIRKRARRLWTELLEADDGWWCVPAPKSGFDPATRLPLEVIEKKTRIRMVLIKPATFEMGSNSGPKWEAPAHEVRIGQAFYLGVFEVKQAEFRRGLPEGYYFSSAARGQHPANGFSWNAIQPFLKRTNLRLPTEAEWEYVARAGYDPSGVDAVAWHRSNSGGRPHVVGAKKANRFGVHDMLGNVAEWVEDPIEPYDGDPRRTKGLSGRVVRGGSVGRPAGDCRPTARRALPPDFRSDTIGFRVARSVR